MVWCYPLFVSQFTQVGLPTSSRSEAKPYYCNMSSSTYNTYLSKGPSTLCDYNNPPLTHPLKLPLDFVLSSPLLLINFEKVIKIKCG